MRAMDGRSGTDVVDALRNDVMRRHAIRCGIVVQIFCVRERSVNEYLQGKYVCVKTCVCVCVWVCENSGKK